MLNALLILFVALVIGTGSTIWFVHHPPIDQSIKNGAWVTHSGIGSAQANMYLRAIVAKIGLFALDKKETVYFAAYRDDKGIPLTADCDYVIEGGDMDTRWWSITVYGEDDFLIPNTWNRYSYNRNNIRRDDKGRYRIHLSGTPKEGDWLPTGGGGKIALTLRLYNPAPTVYENLGTIALPRIMKEGCP
jgi:hypothetical protein